MGRPSGAIEYTDWTTGRGGTVTQANARVAERDFAMSGADDRRFVGKTIYSRLKTEITSLTLEPGAVLSELETAIRYDASRTPVREALHRLAQEGLIERRGRHYVVRQFNWHEVQHLYELREGLEKAAVRLAIERAAEEDIDRLAELVEQQVKARSADDAAAFNALDSEFHIQIAHISGNPLLAEQVSLLHDKVKLIRRLQLSRVAGMAKSISDHRRIIGALRRRDVTTAEAEMSYHMRSTISDYRAATEGDQAAD